ncbi:MAG: ABC transporter ATP-binding protein [Planctomycetota bacterium]
MMDTGTHPLIELRNLCRVFGPTYAVNGVSFEVQKGEVFGYIGPNGAGKTTSMRILATLDSPTSGSAWVDGFSVINDPDKVRKRLGWMPDGFGTYPNVNCEEYLDFFARSYGLRGTDRRKALVRVMGFTQLDRLSQKPIDGLSKGMKQRLCLGRALIHDPQVLILDEPAAGLDPRARIELREMISALAAEGKALLISSHILSELAEMCDRVGIIEQGRLLAVGTVDEILRKSTADNQARAETVAIVIEVAKDPDAAAQWLENQFKVPVKKRLANSITIEFSPDADKRADLLKQMVDQGIEVSDFATRQVSLEDVFLTVTQGKVQ